MNDKVTKEGKVVATEVGWIEYRRNRTPPPSSALQLPDWCHTLRDVSHNIFIYLAVPARLERATFGLGNRCSGIIVPAVCQCASPSI
jgi:hypothetical protein